MARTPLVLGLALALIAGVAACGGSTGDTTPAASTPAATSPAGSPTSTPAATGADAATLFAEDCAGCHKADGSGGFGPDLTGEDNAAGVATKIAEGGGGMPSFSGQLTDAQIEALAGYVVDEL